jgi:nucleotide-binding universal stress UspA family protein
LRDHPDGHGTEPSYGGGNRKEAPVTTHDTAPILLCYDGSAGSQRAIETAGAQFPGRTAIVLYVWSPIAVIAAAYGGNMVSLPAYSDAELEEIASKVAAVGAQEAAAAGLAAEAEIAEVTFDGTARVILNMADRHDASLVVVGARGLSAFKSMLLGSVSHGVAQHAHRPVLIVPPAAWHTTAARQAERETAAV